MDDEIVASPPPSSSPTHIITPPENILEELDSRITTVVHITGGPRQHLLPCDSSDLGAETPQEELVSSGPSDLETTLGQTIFSRRLHHLLRAVQLRRLNSCASLPSSPSRSLATLAKSAVVSDTSVPSCDSVPPLGSDSKCTRSPSASRLSQPTNAPTDAAAPGIHTAKKRSRQGALQASSLDATQYGQGARSMSANTRALKKRRLSYEAHRIKSKGSRAQQPSVAGLSGAFGLRYAKGAGSLRRAESLRAGAGDSTERIGTCVQGSPPSSAYPKTVKNSNKPLTCRALPQVVGGATPPVSDCCAPTVPTTPTVQAAADLRDGLADIPVISPPPFALIPRAPLSEEDGAQRRICRLLEHELDLRIAEGLQTEERALDRQLKRAEDEEEQFWLGDVAECADEDAVDAWLQEEARECRYRPRACDTNPFGVASVPPSRRAGIAGPTAVTGIPGEMMEECMNWILETTPLEEGETSYAPGDLYDILSTCAEVRFHAGHLFLRYFSLLSVPAMPPNCLEDADAIEAVTWDIAVACLALSIKFHRDVLYPLDVIYAHEYLDLAPHALAFDDLENAQRDVLEAVAFRVGSATPGAFMSELWTALPTLRLLLAFDDAWAGAQERTWVLLCDILQRTDALRYPISLLTASALSESIIRVLARKFNTTGCDGRARKLKKRDEQTLRKAAAKASRGVRLDIQEILSITNDELIRCQRWLGFSEV